MRSGMLDEIGLTVARKPRDTTASGGLLRRFNTHANCIARVGTDSQAE